MKIPWWLKVIIIVFDILIISTMIIYSNMYINQNTYDMFTFGIIETIILILMNVLFLIDLMIIICSIASKYKNYILIIISIIILIIFLLFIYMSNDYLNEKFNDNLINEELTKQFNSNYTIIKKEKINNELIYHVILNNYKEVVFKNKVKAQECMWSIDCHYGVVSDYRKTFFNYYLKKYNEKTNNNLKLEIKYFENNYLSDSNDLMNIYYICDNKEKCINNYNILLDFKEYLENNNYQTTNIRINFQDNNQKNIYSENYKEIERNYYRIKRYK